MRNIVFCLLVIIATFPSQAQITQNLKLAALLSESKRDSTQKTERLAALKFHKLINEYRVKNELDTLGWDDTLWVTARNHSIWMGTNNVLSHSQKEGTVNFTGTGPGDRYAYASRNKGSCSWSGENALYNWSNSGRTIKEVSTEMAQQAFDQWKNSPGHDRNMRGPASKVHAVAFYIEPQGPVWATDVFSYQPGYMRETYSNQLASTASVKQNVEVQEPVVKKKAVKKLSIKEKQQLTLTLTAMLESADNVKKSKAMVKAAGKHAAYLASTKDISHIEKRSNPNFYGRTEKSRMMKATWGLYFFTQHKTPVCESVAVVQCVAGETDLDALAVEIRTALDMNKMIEGTSVSKGYGVTVKQAKSLLKFYVVRVEMVKPADNNTAQLTVR